MELHRRSAGELAAAVRTREVAAVEVAGAFLARVEAHDPVLGAFLSWEPERTLDAARAVDRRLARGEDPGPLAGVPVALKDNLVTRDHPTTCASRMLCAYRPPYDATAVARLRAAGAVVLGKTHMDEFAMGSSGENADVPPCRNPWDPERVPGGSSSGSAVAVAAGLAPLALGSDTGGSIRLPASFCGVLGLLPTHGAVSRYGLVAHASSLDQVGPLGRHPADLSLVLRVLVGRDPRDATTAEYPRPERLTAELEEGLGGLRVGVVREMLAEGVDPSVRARVAEALEELARAGATVAEVELPRLRAGIAAYYVVACAEASANLARFDGVRFGRRAPAADVRELQARSRGQGLGAEVKRRILMGTLVLSSGYREAWYRRAQELRDILRRDLEDLLGRFDMLAGPTCPTPAFPREERLGDPLAMYRTDACTLVANLGGLPALSLPCGVTGEGLPVGLQLMAARFGEPTLLRAAHGFLGRTRYHERGALS